MEPQVVWRTLGTGSGTASPLNPFSMHPLPLVPLVRTPQVIADAIPMREVSTTPGFGLRPLTSPRNRPFGLGSDRQLAAFIKGPHMSPAPPPTVGDRNPFSRTGSPCYAPPSLRGMKLPELARTCTRRGLSPRDGFSPRDGLSTAFSLSSTSSSRGSSPRPMTLMPEEAGAGCIVNGSARSPRAFHLKHAENVASYSPRGTTPYPGTWLMPRLEPIDDDLL